MEFCKLTSGLDQKLSRYLGNKHLDNMANCPAKAAYGFMDLDTRTAKWDSRVIYWAKNFVFLQVLQHPFENEGRPIPFNRGYWLNPGEEKCCPSHIFMLCFSISGSEICNGGPAAVPRAHRESPEELLDAILGWAKSLNDVQIHLSRFGTFWLMWSLPPSKV